jgi:signal transduction histidine kinase/DNA-binding NarL/FixJ family response regulator
MSLNRVNELSLRDSCPNEPELRILIVEDNPGDVVIVKELMKSSGINFRLTHTRTLKETLSMFTEKDFDIILLDLGLTDSVGLDTLKKIKVAKVKSPVIVMTGLDDEEVAIESLREGAQDYLVKNKLTSDNIWRSIKYGIERKKILDLQERDTYRFSILSSAAAVLNEYEDISTIFSLICENVKLLLEEAGVIALEFLDSKTVHLSGIKWLKPYYQKIKLLTGVDLNKPVFRMPDQKIELLNRRYDRKLHEIEGGICEIFDGIIEKDKCTELERMLGITKVYAIAFFTHKNFYGGLIIFSQQILGDDEIKMIETLSSQTSLSINRRLIEKELRLSELLYKKLTKELEHRVMERTADLNSANEKMQQELTDRIQAQEALKKSEEQLKELNATKDKFFNIVAHDLKNPFTSLLGSSELLFRNIDQMDYEKIKTLASILNDSAKNGYTILQNLLDWSRSQTGLLKFNPECINLKDLVDENITNLQLFAANKNIDLHSNIKEDIIIFADKNMINTILRNLLSNSAKFTNRGGKVVVSAVIDPTEVILSVKDTGTGISKENIDKLFRIDVKFSMPGTDKEQGTGLGLKLSKEFVEKQGGKIWVESVVNKGSEFKFSIPVKKV